MFLVKYPLVIHPQKNVTEREVLSAIVCLSLRRTHPVGGRGTPVFYEIFRGVLQRRERLVIGIHERPADSTRELVLASAHDEENIPPKGECKQHHENLDFVHSRTFNEEREKHSSFTYIESHYTL
ncbi:MAG: hypothetical protein A4E39_01739 [Methanoregulaceae archaeon PtaB.Bin152]|nr:MAG: hypothetical protein A4E39_01739 [Methanoregulaceae archaeon PtaB.Bin152]